MQGWSRENERLVATVTQQEAAVIRGLVGQVRDMLAGRAHEAPRDELAELTGIRTGPTTAPDDRVLARLLPDFYRLDQEDPGDTGEDRDDAAGAMRSLYEPEVVQAKSDVATMVLETCPSQGGGIALTDQQADGWLTALNDVRLALGTALEIDEETPDELPEDDMRREHLGVYQWLTWVQDSLVGALLT
ncbi:DUF2017 domain-containing protein [Saccharopolyspora sp. CA-218241]|uniref:DUF2017 domain-containing protein n=1 Tax=Saccharopolyspora sp. CA-218241 TaxID=3240027 RepID=UPI003D9798A8